MQTVIQNAVNDVIQQKIDLIKTLTAEVDALFDQMRIEYKDICCLLDPNSQPNDDNDLDPLGLNK